MPASKDKYKNHIIIKGARVNNLKNISLAIPRDKFIVITGLSGSGKSSLAFDTLYAEGQRRYVESLSSYARQFLGRINKPDVDYIKGIPPAIAIEQKVNTHNPRSTVGTSTEVYDYIKLLFSRVGKTYSPVSNKVVKRHNVTDVVNYVLSLKEDSKIIILSPFSLNNPEDLEILLKQGFTRIEINNELIKIAQVLSNPELLNSFTSINIVIDRINVKNDEDTKARLADSVQTAFFEGKGECIIKVIDENKSTNRQGTVKHFSNKFEADGIIFEEPSEYMFSFNNPVGACPACEGFGQIIGIDEDLVIPNKSLSIYQDAIACWKGDKMKKWKEKLIFNANKFNYPVHTPYYKLSDKQKHLLWTGNKYFYGLNSFFKYIEKKNYKIQYRVMLSRYRGKTLCPDCNGARLKKEASYVKVSGKSIQELMVLPVKDLHSFFNNLSLSEYEHKVAKRLLIEINNRLEFLINVGLSYLTLNRLSSSLSGGESQRINIAKSLGSSLVGSLYILDEPSIGLHPRDTLLLIKVLKQLQRIGNTVIVVEHDEEIIKSADEIIDLGPMAGISGGEIIFQGNHKSLMKEEKSLTMQYLTGREKIPVPKHRRKWNNFIEVAGARENNLKELNIKFPLNVITVVTGVSGSGKSSLVKNIFYSALKKIYGGYEKRAGSFDTIKGDVNLISDIEFVSQNPIGRSSRSNPVTYIKAYDEIRKLFAGQKLAKYNGFKASHFSFNIPGGRCEECQGEGIIKVEMQFMADVYLVCENCKGKRFKQEVLDVQYKNKNIYDILELTVDEAIDFFSQNALLQQTNIEKKSNYDKSSTFSGDSADKSSDKIVKKLKPLADVGLGYVKLGQSSTTLSGGESQRVKLASFLNKEKASPCIFVFDEPTIGLHFHDIQKLLDSFSSLIKREHTIIIIEHNIEIIKSADWIIDLGPEGGDGGGDIVFEGTPEKLINCKNSYTGMYLKEKLS